jgi:HK97 family phage prohead protease
MPFGISQSQSDCKQWAAVLREADGSYTTIGCHTSKQAAIDQMVAASIDEGLEPLGQVDSTDERSTVIYNYGTVHITQSEVEIEEEETDEIEEPEESSMGYEERAPSLVAPSFMAESAERGLRLHEQGESGEGLVAATVADARRMANGEALSEAKWRKIAPWIARHIVDLDAVQGDEITPGLVAMLLWGGGSSKTSARRAQAYAERIVAQLDAEEERAPAPKKDQIKGSDENPAGSAADKTGGIELSEATETALQNKADEHNAAMNESDRPNWTRVRVGALRAVYRRGAGAFSTSHRPNMTRAQWAMARVNAFLYLARTGAPENENYVNDNDLLHSEHPKYSESGGERSVSVMLAVMSNEIENRWCVTGADEKRIAYTTLDLRQADNGTTLYGYAAVFDSPSEPMPFVEYVKRGAFSKTIKDGADVRLLIDHEGVPLARTKSGTLRLNEDERGLAVAADLDPMNPDAARIISAMKRGDLSQMSFAFRTIKDSWSDDRSVRELREVQLYDVSVVTFPAYEQTVAEIRGRLLQDEQPAPTLDVKSTSVSVRKAQIALARSKQ